MALSEQTKVWAKTYSKCRAAGDNTAVASQKAGEAVGDYEARFVNPGRDEPGYVWLETYSAFVSSGQSRIAANDAANSALDDFANYVGAAG